MTIEERLEGMAQTLELQISLQADEKKRTDLLLALHEQRMALHEQRMAKLDESQDKTERALRRAIDYSAREMRNERKRRQELDERLGQRLQELAELGDRRHAELEATFKKFLERSGNGQH
jgi:hypothetical protein